jgi:glycine cleavage system H lipoate-binding protein
MTALRGTSTLKSKTTRNDYAKTSTMWKADKDRTIRPCIWMQSGVVAKKNCNHFFDCNSCKYDSAMQKAVDSGKQISWQDAMRMRSSTDRTCRHALTGRADHRICPMNYNCRRCDFDQVFEDTVSTRVNAGAAAVSEIKGFKIADGYYFHKGHTWVSIESGGFFRVGMDDFTFKVLGGPDGFNLPLTGQELNREKPGWGIKREQNFADILSPVNGVITNVNHAVSTSPDIPVNNPYADGWLFTVHNPDLKGAVKELLSDDDCKTWLDGEVTTLETMIETLAGPLSADGGVLTRDVYGNLPTLGWRNLTETFLTV